jgi:hypothetical protein
MQDFCSVADPEVARSSSLITDQSVSLFVYRRFVRCRWLKWRDIRCNKLLTVFRSGFCRHLSTAAAVLKVTEDIRLSIEDGVVAVLLLGFFTGV